MAAHLINSKITKYFEVYQKWVIGNPHLLSDIESVVRCLSYFTAGRFNNSALASELVYSMPNLLVLFNDWLVYTSNVRMKLPQFESKIKIWLTIVEYVEALLEVTAKKVWGESGKWGVILFVQTIKSILKLILVYVYKERVTQNPPIQPLNRDKLAKSAKEEFVKEGCFSLKHSGTVIRRVSATDTTHARKFSPPVAIKENSDQPTEQLKTNRNMLIAETLYIIKPLLHLGCLSIFRGKHWKPWILSLGLDLLSLRLYNREAKKGELTRMEREELIRRRLSLLLYILRSPFYDNCSRVRIYSLLNTLSRTVPFAKLMTEPVAKYLPHWQETYFYMWSC